MMPPAFKTRPSPLSAPAWRPLPATDAGRDELALTCARLRVRGDSRAQISRVLGLNPRALQKLLEEIAPRLTLKPHEGNRP